MLKMIKRADPPVQSRPHDKYRRDFVGKVRSLCPVSVLDVGCGDGTLLRRLAAGPPISCVGLEPDAAVVEKARSEGLDVRTGTAEAIPFSDQSFDVVTLEYVAHHVENLDRALFEAIRVANLAVVVMDCWYDPGLPSQRVAKAFDEWGKRIDRRLSFVHDSCPRPEELAAPFLSAGSFDLDFSSRLILTPLPVSEVESAARERLASVPGSRALAEDLERLLDEAWQHGISDDGAILLSAIRR